MHDSSMMVHWRPLLTGLGDISSAAVDETGVVDPHPLGHRGVIICMRPPPLHTAGKHLAASYLPPPSSALRASAWYLHTHTHTLFHTAGKCLALPPGSLATRGCAPSRRQRTHCCTVAHWQPRSLRLTQCEWVGGWGHSPFYIPNYSPVGHDH